ncbi:VUT family protein [Schauerella aestuarii]|uniref:VUT family protein n=1 Tax=Schauerella aestuarii TaxID=2511204 RepID=UPI002E2B1D69|nr:VUT family protein [Achromobacter aestuarii]
MILSLAIACYAGAMILANLLVVQFGPMVTPINSFFLIGLDLVLRDWLHVKVRPWQMGALIAFAGLLSWILNPAAQFIAIASAVSFAVAALVDWIVFMNVKGSWFKRSMKSNVAGAALDSMLFPAIAFGAFMPLVIVGQFAAKVAGGALWAYLISKAALAPLVRFQGNDK